MRATPKRWMVFYGLTSAALVAAAAFATLLGGRAEVVGGTPVERIACLCRLADKKPRGAAGAIAEATKDPDASVRRAAMVALARFVVPEVRSVIEAGTRDPAPPVRSAAAATLALYRDDPAAERLGQLASADADPAVRLAAIRALGEHASPKASEVLIAVIAKSDAPALKHEGIETMLGLLTRRWPHGPNPWTRPHWEKMKRETYRLMAPIKDGTKVVHDGKVHSL